MLESYIITTGTLVFGGLVLDKNHSFKHIVWFALIGLVAPAITKLTPNGLLNYFVKNGELNPVLAKEVEPLVAEGLAKVKATVAKSSTAAKPKPSTSK